MYRSPLHALVTTLVAFACTSARAQDPCQIQKLPGSDTGGRSVAIDGDWAFVKWRVYQRAGARWVERENIGGGDALVVQGGIAVSGSPRVNHSGFTGAGIAEVFELQPGGFWIETQRLTASDPGNGDGFGVAVSFDGQRIAIGADGFFGPGDGKAYIFEKIGGEWVQTQRLTDPFFRGTRFGNGIAIDGDRLVVGAPGLDASEEDEGIAHIFEFDGDEWRYTDSVGQFRNIFPDANFGRPIVLQGDRLLIGATNWGIAKENQPGTGNIFYYEYRDGDWRLLDDMNGRLGNDGDRLGSGIALVGNVIYAGRPGDDLEDGEDSGSVEIIDIINDRLHPRTRFRPLDDDRRFDNFGWSLDVDGDTMIVGALRDNQNRGAAFVFSLSGDCSEPAILSDVRILDGVIISGGLPQIEESDDQYLETEARVTGEAHRPHLLRLRITAETDAENIAAMTIRTEGFITDIEAQTTARLRDYVNGGFVQVDQFTMGNSESAHTTEVPDAARFVRASEGRIVLEVEQIVFLPFTLNGFHTLFDQVEIAVR